MRHALVIVATVLGLAGIWAAAPTAPGIATRHIWRWVQAWFGHGPRGRVHSISLSGAGVLTVSEGYRVPENDAERIALLWDERPETRRRLTDLELGLEALRATNASDLADLRRQIEQRDDTSVRVNALALPAIAIAAVLAGLADHLAAWLPLAIFSLIVGAVALAATLRLGAIWLRQAA